MTANTAVHDDPHDAVATQAPTAVAGSQHPQFQKAISWEASKRLMYERSERRAWKVAAAAAVVAIVEGIAIAGLTPLKETEPYIIRVDNTTGVPDLVTALDSKGVGYNEVMDKYWLAQYVIARETYDWYTIQKDYDTVGLLSTPAVGRTYAAQFEGENALDKKFGSQVRQTVKIVSVVPNGNGIGTVRFIKTTKRGDDVGPGETAKYIATVAYEYRNPSVMRESARLTNPLGFTVKSYRRDSEVAGGGE